MRRFSGAWIIGGLVIACLIIVCLVAMRARPAAAQEARQPSPLDERIAEQIARLGAEDSREVERAGEALLALGEPAIHAIAAAARDPRVGVRLVAVDLLRESGFAALPVVAELTAVTADEDETVRSTALFILGSLAPASRAALPTLVRRLDVETGESALGLAISAVQAFGTEAAAAAPTLRRLTESSNPLHRLSATEALLRVAPDAGGALYITQLQHDNALLRASAASNLGALAARATPEMRAALRKALADGDASVRVAAAYALTRIDVDGNAEVFPVLVAGLHEESNSRNAASAALSAHGARAVPLLAQALGDADVDVRTAAASSLDGIGPAAASAQDALMAAFADSSADVRRPALSALGKINAPYDALRPTLERALGDEDFSIRRVLHRSWPTMAPPRCRRAAPSATRRAARSRGSPPARGWRWPPSIPMRRSNTSTST